MRRIAERFYARLLRKAQPIPVEPEELPFGGKTTQEDFLTGRPIPRGQYKRVKDPQGGFLYTRKDTPQEDIEAALELRQKEDLPKLKRKPRSKEMEMEDPGAGPLGGEEDPWKKQPLEYEPLAEKTPPLETIELPQQVKTPGLSEQMPGLVEEMMAKERQKEERRRERQKAKEPGLLQQPVTKLPGELWRRMFPQQPEEQVDPEQVRRQDIAERFQRQLERRKQMEQDPALMRFLPEPSILGEPTMPPGDQ